MKARVAIAALLSGCIASGPDEPSGPASRQAAVVVLGSSRWKSEFAITSLAASSDGSLLAVGDAAGDVRVLRAGDGSVLHAFSDHARRVRGLAFSPDGTLLASVGEDRRAVLRRASDGARVSVTHSPVAGFYSFAAAAFSPDGRDRKSTRLNSSH